MEPRWLSFALIIFGILAFLEVQVASKWVTTYYRHGICVFVKQYRIVQPEKFKLCIQRLQWRFDTRELPALDFHILTQTLCAFRERVFFPRDDDFSDRDPWDPWDLPSPGTVTVRTRRTYVPLIHGLIELEPHSGILGIKGYLNWFPIWFCTIWSAVVLPQLSRDNLLIAGIFLVMIPLSICVSTFVTQIKRYTEIAELAAKSLSQGRLVPNTADGNQQSDV